MMNLEDPESGQQGYLSLLSGLSKLTTLQGCFDKLTKRQFRTIGQLEAPWMAEYWPGC